MTLPAHMVVDNGIQCIEELPDQHSLIRVCVYDLDVAGAYPNGESILNASRETTAAEVVKIKGVREKDYRNAALNLTAGTTNAVEICCSVMGAPTFHQLLQEYETLEGECESV